MVYLYKAHSWLILCITIARCIFAINNITVEAIDPSIIYSPVQDWIRGACGVSGGGAGVTASFSFNGIAIHVGVVPGVLGGENVASVTLDGAQVDTLTIGQATGGSFGSSTTCDTIAFNKDGLDDTHHTIVLEYIRENNGRSLGDIELTQFIYTVTGDESSGSGSNSSASSTSAVHHDPDSTSFSGSPTSAAFDPSQSNNVGSKSNLGLILGLSLGIGGFLIFCILGFFIWRSWFKPNKPHLQTQGASGVFPQIFNYFHGPTIKSSDKSFHLTNKDNHEIKSTVHRNAHNAIPIASY